MSSEQQQHFKEKFPKLKNMTAKENLESYKVMVNFNQDLIKNTETFKKLKFYPIIEADLIFTLKYLKSF
jgi:hypothetical protein